MTRTRSFQYLFAVASILAGMACAYAGGDVGGNGTDRLPYNHGSAWFTGIHNQIRYCISFDAKFGISKDVAEKNITDAYSIWSNYLGAKLQWDHHLTTDLRRMPVCDGTEDLKFYFGLSSDEVQKYRSKFIDPIAFSERTEFNEDKGWGKGFIWIGSAANTGIDWGLTNNLLGILLHEFGHVLGCSHIDGTIMRENNDKYFGLSANAPDRRFLGQIDGQRDLYLNAHSPFSFTGAIAYGYEKHYNRPDTTTAELELLFKTFLNRSPRGHVHAKLSGTESPTNDQYRYRLELGDEAGTEAISITFTENHDWSERPFDTHFDQEGYVFRVLSAEYSSVFSNMGMWAYGTAVLQNGKSIPIFLERNLASKWSEKPRFLTLKYVVDGSIHNLFRAER